MKAPTKKANGPVSSYDPERFPKIAKMLSARGATQAEIADCLNISYAQFKRWMSDSAPTSSSPGFTLSDLRQMHREGKMTDEEYQQARDKMVSSAKKMADSLPDPLAGRRKPPESASYPERWGDR